jgi:Arc/MetJ-type ribon-helix-helix transcriptional regulator
MQQYRRNGMKSYQVTLPDEVATFVDRAVAGKQWGSVEDLIAYALLQVEAEMALERDTDVDSLRKAVQVGIDQADRGELVDGPGVMKRLRDKLEAARKQPT